MRRRSEYVVWGGVVTGMDLCQSSDTPLTTLGWFLGKLRRIGWHPADTRLVENCILELLQSRRDNRTAHALVPTSNGGQSATARW